MKPAVIIVGADKGGVGKTTISRTLLDFMASRNLLARAFDSEYPRGSLKRFHPNVTEVIDVTAVPDQMKMLDTLAGAVSRRRLQLQTISDDTAQRLRQVPETQTSLVERMRRFLRLR